MLKKLPIGISDFYIFRTEDYLYVDKTSYIQQLFAAGHKYYFLARPRRFGKSLLVSTLYEALAGNQALFTGLALADADYDWRPHGIIKFDLSMLGIEDGVSLKAGICTALSHIVDQYELKITINFANPSLALQQVVMALHQKFGRVAILIDEYDNPILHALDHPQRALEIRDGLQYLFRTIKGLSRLINFVFITGITSFSKAGLFSGLNNLHILTLDAKYGAICGYTDPEIDAYFAPYLLDWAQQTNQAVTDLRAKLRTWYNGYYFGKQVPAVYNPFSLTNALNQQEFQNFWIQSGTPTFLVKELAKEYRAAEYSLLEPEKFELANSALGAFDIGMVALPALMFQAGYLTAVNYDSERETYQLGYPNREVREAAQWYLLAVFTENNVDKITSIAPRLWTAWNNGQIEDAMQLLRQLFAKVPYPLHVNLESFYHSLLQMICTVASIKAQAEYNTSHGRIDLVMDLPKVLYIVEIKLNESAAVALQQILDKRYYEPFVAEHKPIVLLGLNFSKTSGNFALTHAYQMLQPS